MGLGSSEKKAEVQRKGLRGFLALVVSEPKWLPETGGRFIQASRAPSPGQNPPQAPNTESMRGGLVVMLCLPVGFGEAFAWSLWEQNCKTVGLEGIPKGPTMQEPHPAELSCLFLQSSRPEVFLDVVERLTVIIAANVSRKQRQRFPFAQPFPEPTALPRWRP